MFTSMVKSIKAWFPKPKPVQIRVIQRDVTRMTIAEWRSNPALVQLAANLLRDVNFRMMLDVIRYSHQSEILFPDTAPEVRTAYLGRVEGYTMCLNDIEALGQFKKAVPAIESEFAPEELSPPETNRTP